MFLVGLLDFLCAACFQVLSLVCLFGQLFFVNCLLCVAALCVFAVCFCFGLVTNPLDCFLIVFFFCAVRFISPFTSLLGRAAAFLKLPFCVGCLICLLCVAAVLLR